MPITVLGLFQGASLDALRALGGARRDPPRLRHDRARQGPRASARSIVKHVVRNALIPVVTLVALQMPAVFGGAIVTEQIFRIPGIGSLLISAILRQRHAGDHGGDLRVRLPRHPLQPDRRYALWLARPSHLLPLSAGAAARRRPARMSRPGSRRGGASAATAWRSRARSILVVMVLGGRCSGRSLWRVPINDIDFTARLAGARPGRIRSAPTISARTCWRACSTAGASRSRSGSPRCWSRSSSARSIGAVAGMSRGSVDAGADVAHRPVPVAAAAAAAAAGHLPVPRLAEERCSGPRAASSS